MDSTNALKKPQGLAGDIPSQTLDVFSPEQKISPETKLLVDKIERKEQNLPEPVVAKPPKKETFIDRLFRNSKPTSVKPGVTGGSTPAAPLKKRDFSKFVRGFLIVLILLVICFGGYLFLFLTNIDTQLMKLTLKGTVTDAGDQKPVKDADIFIDNTSVGKTDANGKYSITLEDLTFDFRVTAKDFNEFSENITIPRSVLNYTFTKDISLTSTKVAQVNGKFTTDKPNYKFTNDKLFFNEEEFILNEDGSYSLTKVLTGKVSLVFESENFIDVKKEITLSPGLNTIADIRLTQAGDVVGSVASYVREDLVTKTKFSIENVLDEQITINNEGKFRIRDLEVGRTYKIRSMADGYETRDYEIKVIAGENELFGFKMIESGTAIFMSKSEDKKDHFYSSDLDGFNPTSLEAIANFLPRNEYFDASENLLYFFSNHERISGSSRTAELPYSLNPDTKEVKQLVTSNLNKIDTLTSNFESKKMINNLSYRTGTNERKRDLQVMNLDGSDLKVLRTINDDQNFDNILISRDGKFSVFREGDISRDPDVQPTVYRVDNSTNQAMKVVQRNAVTVHAISADGNLIIYSALNESTTFRDLYLFTAFTNETRTIKENHDGTSYRFLNQNNDIVIFIAKRDGRMDIYSYSISQNSTNRVTSLSATEEVTALYQQDDFTFYITKRGLYVIDILKPHSYKLVTDKISKYTN